MPRLWQTPFRLHPLLLASGPWLIVAAILAAEPKSQQPRRPARLLAEQTKTPEAAQSGQFRRFTYTIEPALERVGEEEAAALEGDAVGPRSGAHRGKPLDPAAPSVVILPPKLSGTSSQRARTIAELACDRFAQELDLGGLAQVVDRARLDEVLRERELAGGAGQAMLGYDAILRLEIDYSLRPPRSRLRLVELSTGNALGEKQLGWPVKEADVAPVVEVCRKALSGIAKGQKENRVKIRLVGLEDAKTSSRMRPLARRLEEIIRSGLASSKQIVPVQHLEAGSAKEESLLVAMGLSRLPGGRQFAPQADATVEVRIEERDAVGRSFEDTPIEIGVQLRHGTKHEGQWVLTAGIVREFDAAAGKAWDKLAKSLGEIGPVGATPSLPEMALRRRQAELELKAAMAVDYHLPRKQRAAQRLAHAEAALKLDPTLEPAACLVIENLSDLVVEAYNTPDHEEMMRRLAREVAAYFERFPGSRESRDKAQRSLAAAVQLSPLGGLREGERPVHMTDELRDVLDCAKRVVELSLECDAGKCNPGPTSFLLPIVYRGMKLNGAALAERQKLLEDTLRRMDKFISQKGKVPHHLRDNADASYQSIRLWAARLLAGDGQREAAKKLLDPLLEAWPRKKFKPDRSTRDRARETLVLIGDSRALEAFDSYISGRSKPLGVSIKWPKLDLFGDADNPRDAPSAPTMTVPYFPKDAKHFPRLQPLAEAEDRMYFINECGDHQVGYFPVNAEGRPVGQAVPVKPSSNTRTWNTISILPAPKAKGELKVLCAHHCSGKLFLGTENSGLLCYDAKSDKWRNFGPEEGAPCWKVESIFAWDGNLLYCAGSGGGHIAHFTLDVHNGQVKLAARQLAGSLRAPPSKLSALWRDGDRVMGWTHTGLWTDVLSDNRQFAKFRPFAPRPGWPHAENAFPVGSALAIGSRRFVFSSDGLMEHDDQGRPLRHWRRPYDIAPKPRESMRFGSFTVPGEAPLPELTTFAAVCGKLLVCGGIAYDPQNDTWYGPVRGFGVGSPHGTVATSRGIWTTYIDGALAQVNVDDFLEAARKAGRAMTSAEFLQRRQHRIDTAEPLDRIKFAIELHELDRARSLLTEFLGDHADDPEAQELKELLKGL